jgi:hypothetical protein
VKANEYLADFVAKSLAAGQGRDAISTTLQQAGWPSGDIRRALAQWADPAPDLAGQGLPVPRPAAHVSARDAFTYGLIFTALAMVVWHINSLGFDLIDRALGNDSTGYLAEWTARSIRWSIAMLAVATPAFLWLTRSEAQRRRADPAQARSALRKWFGFITLYLAALGMAGDLVATIYAFLNGDLTLQFIAKAALVLLTAGLVFLYYRNDLRQTEDV